MATSAADRGAAGQGSADATDFAVIGGGAAAAAMLAALAAQERKPSVLWVAPAGEDGRGAAYRTRDPAHRLNVRAGRMSIRADLAGDFVDFLSGPEGRADAQAFYPRGRYGDYLAARLAESLKPLAADHWAVTAHGVSLTGDRWRIEGSDGQQRHARRLVLALGPLPTRAPPGVASEVIASGRFRCDPYGWSESPRSAGDLREVWILGSGLTAVDLALTVVSAYPGARIRLLSRHGALPAAHSDASAPCDPLDRQPECPSARAMLRLLRDRCECASDWRNVIDGLRAQMADRWQGWPEPEQRRFLRHLRWAWDLARHRMAPEVAGAISEMQSTGQLTVSKGRLLGAVAAGRGIRLRWRPRGGQASREDSADLVLQATGLDTRVSDTQVPLLRNLLNRGLARPDALDMGLAVDPMQRLVDAQGRPHAHAHVLGALARGSRFECIAMPEIRSAAAAIAGSFRAGGEAALDNR